MQILKISDITILPGRQRREFDPIKMVALQGSITKIGLQNPIVVRKEGEKWILVSGERRLRAIKDCNEFNEPVRHGLETIPPGYIPTTDFGDLPPLLAKKCELEENIRRENLSWQEETAAFAEIAAVESEMAELDGRSTPTAADLADEYLAPKRSGVGKSDGPAEASRRLVLARNLDDPEVASAKTANDAYGILKRKADAARHAELARVVGPSLSSASHTLLHGDAIAEMEKMAAESYDVVLSDPPYGMDAQDFGDAGGRLTAQTHEYEDSYSSWQSLMQRFTHHSYRVAKAEAHAYLCCDFDRFHELKIMMETAGWYVHRTPLINVKVNGNRVPLPEHGPQRKWEMILYAIKGWKKVTKIYSDVIETRGDDNLGHGAQKPVELFVNLLRRSVRPGDTVLDPFAGTGTVFPAAQSVLCRATGIEKDEVYYGIAAKRLKEVR